MRTKRYVPFTIGVVSLVAAILLMIYTHSWIGDILSAFALACAYYSIKDAICLTDEEIEEIAKF